MKQLLLIVSIFGFFGGMGFAQPAITSVSPSRNAINVSASSNITITFSEPMNNLEAIQPNSVLVKGSLGGKYTTTKSLDAFGTTLTLNPDSDFLPGEIITVRVSQILNEEQNSGLQHPTVYQFTVASSGTGVGYFNASDKFTTSDGSISANLTYVGDLDGDGDLDAIVMNRYGDLKFSVLRKQDGSDTYFAADTYDIADGSNPQGATLHDVDNDGDLDFVVFVNPGVNTRSFYVYTNTGYGAFTSTGSSFHSYMPTDSVGVGVFSDVDRDGMDELFMLADNINGLWPFDNNGTGGPASFLEGSSVGPYGSIAGRLAISRDFNNDDYPDFAIIKKVNFNQAPTNDSLGVLLSNGSGGFTAHTYNFGVDGSSFNAPWGMDAGDFDGDGYIDLAIQTSDSLFIFDNNQDGSFATPRGFDRNYSSGDVKVADMDNDGDLDVVVLGSYTSIFYNDGSGNFNDAFGFSRGYSGLVAALGDADGDGDLDILYSVNNTMTVLRNSTVTAPTTSSYVTTYTNNYGNSVTVSWSSGNGGKTLLLAKEGSAVDASPVDNTIYTADANFGDGSEIGAGNFVVYSNSGNSATITGLTPETTYHFALVEFNSAGPNAMYRTSVNTGNVTTVNEPQTEASSISFSSKTNSKFDINWTNGSGQNRIVVVKEGSAVDGVPTNSTTYSDSTVFGLGTQIGTGNYVVYNGNGSSVTVTGLSSETTYHVAVFEYNGEDGSGRFKTDSYAIGNTTTKGVPSIWSKNDSTLVFTKANSADYTQAANQDRITENLWITRANSGYVFNHADETEAGSSSPSGTQWALGTTDNLDTLNFQTFGDLWSEDVKNIAGNDMVIYSETDNLYFDINFSSWTSGQSGGGFSYTRAKGPEPAGVSQTFQDSAGYAIQFDGGNTKESYLEIYMSDYSMGSYFTTEMWIKPDSVGIDQVFLTLYDAFEVGINSSNQFFAYHSQNNAGGGGGEEWKIVGSNKGSGSLLATTDPVTITSTSTAVKDQWYHVAVTGESGGLLTLYVNGVAEDTVSVTDISLDENYWWPGTNFDEDKFFYGTLDELRIWKSVRTVSEIRSFMHRPFEGQTGRLIGYWQFNEGTGTSTYDGYNNLEATLYQETEAAWVTSDAPLGVGTVEEASDFQNGTQAVGNAALTMAEGFDNPVDVQVTEVTANPNVFPSGYTAGVGGKYFVINLFGDPGTFSANLTLTYGPGVITSIQEANPSLLKLYKRSSNSTGAWTEIASANSAVASTGVVTWSGITSFSQFMSVADEYVPPTFSIGISDSSDVIAFTDSVKVFGSDFFSLPTGFEDSVLTIQSKTSLAGILYLDQNSNLTYDSGTDSVLTANTTYNYTPSGTVKLVYRNNNAGLEQGTIKMELNGVADSVALDYLTVEATPTFNGNSSENGWYLITNPMDTPLGTLLSNVWTQGAINSNASGGDKTLYRFNQATAQYESITTDLDTTKLQAGEGLLAYLFEDDDLGDEDVDGGWPKTLSNYGNPFGSTASITLKNVDSDGVSGTSGSEGFALFGNPFAWAISSDSVIASLKAEDALANSYVYRWNPTAKTYQILSSGQILPYESVFVRVISSGTTANLSFDYNDALAGSPKQVAEQRFALHLSNTEKGLESDSYIRIDKEGSAEIDPYDGYYLGTYASHFANLYTLVGDQALTINNLPANLAEETEYPIYLHTSETGTFNLSWTSASIPDGWEFTLIDVATGESIDMKQHASMSLVRSSKEKTVANSGAIFTHPGAVKGKGTNAPQPDLLFKVRNQTQVGNEEDMGIPTVVELYQNYPNPFNPTSVIRYGVPEASNVRLEVFDMLGRRVMTLINNELKQPGRYNVDFNANQLASGVYVYRLVIGNSVLTKRMTLIK